MPTIGPSLRLSYRSTWSSSNSYAINDVVAYQGSSYIATAASTSSSPQNPATAVAYWAVLAAQGTKLTATVQSAAYSAVVNDLVLANALSAAFTVTLPTGPAANGVITVKKTDASANVVTVVPGGSATIDGDANLLLTAQGASATMQYDGTNWQVRDTAILAQSSPYDAVSTLYTPTYRSQYWYDRRSAQPIYNPAAAVATASTPAQATLFYLPVYLHTAQSIDAVGYITGTTAPTAGASVRIGLYTANGLAGPGSLLYDWGLVSLGSAASTLITITGLTAVLPRGWSYFALSYNNTAPGTCLGLGAATPISGVPAASFTGAVGNFATAPAFFTASGSTTAAALGSTASATASYAVTLSTSYSQNVYFKVV